MHFGLFLGGLTMLVGSCVIVCVCKSCKRRSARNKVLGKNCKVPPTVSLAIDKKAETAAYLNSLQIMDSPMLANKMCPSPGDSPKSRTSSKDSCDSTKGLLGQSTSLPNRLEVPTHSSDWLKRSGSVYIIPSICIDPVISTTPGA